MPQYQCFGDKIKKKSEDLNPLYVRGSTLTSVSPRRFMKSLGMPVLGGKLLLRSAKTSDSASACIHVCTWRFSVQRV